MDWWNGVIVPFCVAYTVVTLLGVAFGIATHRL